MANGANSSEKGLALIITILITAMLVAVISEVVYSVHIQLMRARSMRDGVRANVLAEGGVRLAAMTMADLFKDKEYTAYRPEDATRVVPVDYGVLTLKIEDEQGKFSLNSMVYSNGATNDAYYDMYSRLINGLKLEEGLSASLADWIDPDDAPRSGGAETNDYYKAVKPAYASKGAYLDSVEELMLVKGYDRAVFKGISPFVTAYTDGKININTASKEVIMAISDDITESMAEDVIEYRAKKPFKSTADIRKVAGFDVTGFDIQDRITVKSYIFRVFSTATVGESVKSIEAVVDAGSSGKALFWRVL